MTIVLAAALGSLAATVAFSFMVGGTGTDDPGRFVLGFASGTMIFTVPGALMLRGLQAILQEHAVPSLAAGFLLVVVGGTVGGLVLGFLSETLFWLAIGALYGALTAIALLSIQVLIRLSPSTAR